MQYQPLTPTVLLNLISLPASQPQRSPSQFHGLGVTVLAAIALVTQAASALALSNWRYDPTANQLEVTVKAGTTPKYFVMAQPARIVLDLPDTEMGDVKAKESFAEGAIRQVRVSQFQPGTTRIVMELAPDIELAPGQVKLDSAKGVDGDRWILRPLIVGSGTSATPATSSNFGQKQSASPTSAESPAVGSDVSPVTPEMMAAASVPPPPPAAIPAKVNVAVPSIAQLPAESTTPLPPNTSLPPSGLEIDTQNAVKISVPAPVVLPETPSAKVVVTEMPSTVRSLPVNGSPQVVVPTLNTSSMPTLQPVPVRVTPPAIAVPPLNSVIPPVTSAPVVRPSASTVLPTLDPPAGTGRIIETKGGLPVSTVIVPSQSPGLPSPITPNPPAPNLKPPSSWVMQSNGVSQPGWSSLTPVMPPSVTPIAPPPVAKMMPPPNSWVMQSSGMAQPSVTCPLQPPVSSVIQPTAISQTPMLNSPMPSSSVMQFPGTPAAGVSLAPSLVNVPPLQFSSPSNPTGMVSVPPLQPASAQPVSTAQPVSMSGNPASTVSVPPLQPAFASAPTPSSTNSSVIEFGKPLPTSGAIALNTVPQGIPLNSTVGVQPSGFGQSTNSAIALSAGTLLALSYPGPADVQLDASQPRQDMMVLQTEVRDAAGNVVFPQGSYVMGQFETTREGSKFVTSGIQRGDRIIPFYAESELLNGNREISTSSMAIYSGAGALAGGLISKFSGLGLLLGGAAGAATNYFTSPKPALVKPGQMIQVRMLRDVPY